MDTPVIFTSGALVIGLCVGEYLDHDHKGDFCGMSFEGIRRLIYEAERELNERPATELFPEKLILNLSPAIEALARRVWPNYFVTSLGRESLCSVLCQRLRAQNLSPPERRFANVALTLHKSYRNPVLHEFDNFKCSLDEARFFLLGVRTLFELAERVRF